MLFRLKKLELSIALVLSVGSQQALSQFDPALNLSDLDGSNGFVINGVNASDYSGYSVSNAGDINGDGIDDVIVGAERADPNSNTDAGSSYVVFGSDSGLPHPFELSTLNGLNGFEINGANSNDRFGTSVSAAGDINGDGIDDVVVGALTADPNGNSNAGSTYVVFGSNSVFPNPFEMSTLDGLNGFEIKGEIVNDNSGRSVSAAGDVNGDGVDDLIVGADGADPNGNNFAGSSYVVFGSQSSLPHPLDLSTINGVNGFVINGVDVYNFSGRSVSAAGDINGDGFDDVVVGAMTADPNGNSYAGSAYVVFGSDSSLPHPFNLSTLNGVNGFVLNGVNADDFTGYSVSNAGDVNGDGIDDLIVGASGADPNGNSSAGNSYVVFGSQSSLPNPFDLSTLNGLNGFVIHGVNENDISGRSVSAAGDVNGDGIDDVIVGAYGTDSNGNYNAGSCYVLFGSDSGFPHPFDLSTLNGENGFVINGVDAFDQLSGRSSVSAAGDVNGDGIDDVIIGAYSASPNDNSRAGSSYVVFGREKPIFKDGFE